MYYTIFAVCMKKNMPAIIQNYVHQAIMYFTKDCFSVVNQIFTSKFWNETGENTAL